jgi:hypothetical protein
MPEALNRATQEMMEVGQGYSGKWANNLKTCRGRFA